MSLLITATAVEDSILETTKRAEDVVVHMARTFAEGVEPLNKYLPERRLGVARTEVVEHTFGFVDGLVANLRDFTSQLVALVPDKGEARPTAVKASSKARAA
jgi:hypothetical protein